MALFVLRKLILQTRIRSHSVGLDVWVLVGPFVYFHTSCVRTVTAALARLGGCAGSPEPSLVACVISTVNSWAGWFVDLRVCYIINTVLCLLSYSNLAICNTILNQSVLAHGYLVHLGRRMHVPQSYWQDLPGETVHQPSWQVEELPEASQVEEGRSWCSLWIGSLRRRCKLFLLYTILSINQIEYKNVRSLKTITQV